jgi:hypothetical protein
MYCSKCKAQIPDDAAFCQACGSKVVVTEGGVTTTGSPQDAMVTRAPSGGPQRRAGYCEVCGQELGVNEKMRGLSAHQKCPEPTLAGRGGAEAPNLQGPSASTEAPVRPLATTPRSRYAGASAVATTLWILGWLIAVVAFIGAAYNVSTDPCKQYDICGDGESWFTMGSFFGTLIVGWLVAVSVLWAAYILRLLSDVEGRLRS